MKWTILLSLFAFSNAELLGCMHYEASNYNALATVDDGSCVAKEGWTRHRVTKFDSYYDGWNLNYLRATCDDGSATDSVTLLNTEKSNQVDMSGSYSFEGGRAGVFDYLFFESTTCHTFKLDFICVGGNCYGYESSFMFTDGMSDEDARNNNKGVDNGYTWYADMMPVFDIVWNNTLSFEDQVEQVIIDETYRDEMNTHSCVNDYGYELFCQAGCKQWQGSHCNEFGNADINVPSLCYDVGSDRCGELCQDGYMLSPTHYNSTGECLFFDSLEITPNGEPVSVDWIDGDTLTVPNNVFHVLRATDLSLDDIALTKTVKHVVIHEQVRTVSNRAFSPKAALPEVTLANPTATGNVYLDTILNSPATANEIIKLLLTEKQTIIETGLIEILDYDVSYNGVCPSGEVQGVDARSIHNLPHNMVTEDITTINGAVECAQNGYSGFLHQESGVTCISPDFQPVERRQDREELLENRTILFKCLLVKHEDKWRIRKYLRDFLNTTQLEELEQQLELPEMPEEDREAIEEANNTIQSLPYINSTFVSTYLPFGNIETIEFKGRTSLGENVFSSNKINSIIVPDEPWKQPIFGMLSFAGNKIEYPPVMAQRKENVLFGRSVFKYNPLKRCPMPWTIFDCPSLGVYGNWNIFQGYIDTNIMMMQFNEWQRIQITEKYFEQLSNQTRGESPNVEIFDTTKETLLNIRSDRLSYPDEVWRDVAIIDTMGYFDKIYKGYGVTNRELMDLTVQLFYRNTMDTVTPSNNFIVEDVPITSVPIQWIRTCGSPPCVERSVAGSSLGNKVIGAKNGPLGSNREFVSYQEDVPYQFWIQNFGDRPPETLTIRDELFGTGKSYRMKLRQGSDNNSGNHQERKELLINFLFADQLHNEPWETAIERYKDKFIIEDLQKDSDLVSTVELQEAYKKRVSC